MQSQLARTHRHFVRQAGKGRGSRCVLQVVARDIDLAEALTVVTRGEVRVLRRQQRGVEVRGEAFSQLGAQFEFETVVAGRSGVDRGYHAVRTDEADLQVRVLVVEHRRAVFHVATSGTALHTGLDAPHVFRVDDGILATDVDDARLKAARQAAVPQLPTLGGVLEVKARRNGIPRLALVRRHVGAQRIEDEGAGAITLLVVVASTHGQLQLVVDGVGTLQEGAVRVRLHRTQLPVVAVVEQVGRCTEEQAEIGERHLHGAEQLLVEVHDATEQVPLASRAAESEFLTPGVAVFVVVVLAEHVHVGDVEVVTRETLEIAPGGHGLHVPLAQLEVHQSRQADAVALVDGLLVGVDVTQIRCLATRSVVVENGLAAEQVVPEAVFRRSGRAEIVEGVVVVVFLEVVGNDRRLHVIAGGERHHGANGYRVAVVDLAAGEQVLAVAITLVPLHGHTSTDSVGHRAAYRTFKGLGSEVADRQTAVAVQGIAGLASNEVHHAGGSAAAVGGALRAAQHFHLFQVEEAGQLSGRTRDHGAVLQEGHGTVGTEVDAGHADAADEGTVHAELVTDGEIGHRRGEVGDVFDATGTELVCRNGRNGGRRAVDGVRLLGGGDDDFLEAIAGCLLRGRAGCGEQQGSSNGTLQGAGNDRTGGCGHERRFPLGSPVPVGTCRLSTISMFFYTISQYAQTLGRNSLCSFCSAPWKRCACTTSPKRLQSIGKSGPAEPLLPPCLVSNDGHRVGQVHAPVSRQHGELQHILRRKPRQVCRRNAWPFGAKHQHIPGLKRHLVVAARPARLHGIAPARPVFV